MAAISAHGKVIPFLRILFGCIALLVTIVSIQEYRPGNEASIAAIIKIKPNGSFARPSFLARLHEFDELAHMQALERCSKSIKSCPNWKDNRNLDTICLQNSGTLPAQGIGCTPQRFSWNRTCAPGSSNIYVIAAGDAHFAPFWDSCGCKILITVEPPAIIPQHPEVIAKYYDKADIILSNFKVPEDPLRKVFPFTVGTTWMKEEERRVFKKTRNISIIASEKRSTEGHKLRHVLIDKYAEAYNISLYGGAYLFVASKSEALREYRYSIIIENSREAYYITEKLLDAVLSGTIPIYWGAPVAAELFDADGIMCFQDENDIAEVLQMATPENYDRRRPAVLRNFEQALRYICPDERIQTDFFSPIYELLSYDDQ